MIFLNLQRQKKPKLDYMNMLKGLFSRVIGRKAIVLMSLFALLTYSSELFAQAKDVLEAPKEFSMDQSDWVRMAYWVLALLVLAIIVFVFDIGSLSEKLTGRTVIKWNKVNGWMGIFMIVFGTVGVTWELIYHGKLIALGDSASAHGITLDSMFNWTFGFTFVVFVITEVLLFYFMYRYSYREGEKATYYYHNNKLEVLWTSVPAVVLTFLVLRGFNTWSKITNEDSKDATHIEVFAYQFGWTARYAGEDNQFGDAHFTFISGKNELGLAIPEYVDSLQNELKSDIDFLKSKLEKDSLDSKLKKVKSEFEAYTSKFKPDYDKAKYKQLKDAYDEMVSGSYERQLRRDLKRKEVQLERVVKYREDKEIFNRSAEDDLLSKTEIVLIKNKPYVFNFRARDVIHSAYMPEFRAQMNCVPGMSTRFAFTPIKSTKEARVEKANQEYDYYLFCNKICGGSHYNMKIKITVVESEAEYTAWLKQQARALPLPIAEQPKTEEAPTADSASNKKTGQVIHAKTNGLAIR